MRIAMIGQKHFGSREGGVEVVVTELAKRLAALGNEVTCYDRSASDVMTGEKTDSHPHMVDGVRVVPVRTIGIPGLAAASSSYFATRQAIKDHPDIIHYHAEGPCVPLRLAFKAGIPTVATIHGLDWQRAKWGKLASRYIKLGEKTAARYADAVIVLSKNIQNYFLKTYNRDCVVIPNGVERHQKLDAKEITARWGLSKNSYFLFVGRIVPEKGLHYLIQAFKRLPTDKRLVIAGNASDTNSYFNEIQKLAQDDSRILFTGFVHGRTLGELYSNAFVYVLPSDVEGMPLSLLEAMSYGCCCVTSDIPECKDVINDAGYTFNNGNDADLISVLSSIIRDPDKRGKMSIRAIDLVHEEYSWNPIIEKTLRLYKQIFQKNKEKTK